MGIIKGSATLTRYRVKGELPSDAAGFLDQRIRRFAFRDIEDSAEEEAAGWCSIHDFMDTGFSYAAYSLEPYVLLGLRMDARKLGAALVRKYHRLEMAKARAAAPERRLGRVQREELKEKVRMDLLRRMPPASRLYEVVWNTHTMALWLGASTGAVRETFEELFRNTFELELMPVIPWHMARELAPKASRDDLEELRPLSLYRAEA